VVTKSDHQPNALISSHKSHKTHHKTHAKKTNKFNLDMTHVFGPICTPNAIHHTRATRYFSNTKRRNTKQKQTQPKHDHCNTTKITITTIIHFVEVVTIGSTPDDNSVIAQTAPKTTVNFKHLNLIDLVSVPLAYSYLKVGKTPT
jgi:hypothetical protein